MNVASDNTLRSHATKQSRRSTSRAYHRAATHADALVKHGNERRFRQTQFALTLRHNAAPHQLPTPSHFSRTDPHHHHAVALVTHGSSSSPRRSNPHARHLKSSRRSKIRARHSSSSRTPVNTSQGSSPAPHDCSTNYKHPALATKSPCSLPMGPSVPCHSSHRFGQATDTHYLSRYGALMPPWGGAQPRVARAARLAFPASAHIKKVPSSCFIPTTYMYCRICAHIHVPVLSHSLISIIGIAHCPALTHAYTSRV
jgi:hypothetical protein